MYGFEGEVLHKYDRSVMSLFTEVFNQLPLAACLDNSVMIVHGGLFDRVSSASQPASPSQRVFLLERGFASLLFLVRHLLALFVWGVLDVAEKPMIQHMNNPIPIRTTVPPKGWVGSMTMAPFFAAIFDAEACL